MVKLSCVLGEKRTIFGAFHVFNIAHSLISGGQVVSVNVKVSVTDANDNQPIFSPQSYAANVRTNTQIGNTVIVVKATDADSGTMGNISYRIKGGDGAGLFSIDSVSGIAYIS